MPDNDLFAAPSQDEIAQAKDSQMFSAPKPEELSKASAYPQQQTAASGLGNLYDKAKAQVGGLVAGAQEGMPFSGLIDKVGAANYATLQKLTDTFRDQGKPFGEYYEEGLRGIKGPREDAIANAPTAGAIGSAVGAATGLAMPIPGAGMSGAAGVATRLASVPALSALEAGTSGQGLFDPEKAKQAATLGGGIQAAAEALPVVGKLAAPLGNSLGGAAEKLGQYFKTQANESAVKAAAGGVTKSVKELGSQRIQKAGEALLDTGAVSAGASASSIAQRASDAADGIWEHQITPVLNQLDENGVKISGQNIANDILERASKIADVPQNESVIDAMQKQALFYEKKGDLTFTEAQQLKNNYKWKFTDPQSHVLGIDGNNQVKQAIGNAIKDTAVGNGAPDNFIRDYQRYGLLSQMADAATTKTTRLVSNRTPSLTDYLAAEVGANVGKQVGPGLSGMAAFAAGTANYLGRQFGRSTMAAGYNNLANILQNSPETLGNFGGVLEDAARRGTGAFAVTHALLMNDPKYRQIVEQ